VPPRQAIALPRRRASGWHGAKAVGSFVPGLTRKAFEKYGFSTVSLVTDWVAIAGKELAAYSAPERLKWPRGVDADEEGDDMRGRDKRRRGATLVLRVEGERAIDVQYSARQIIERINGYFGYAAVAQLRIVQGPVARAAPAAKHLRPSAPEAHARPPQELAGIADAGLRTALTRLGTGVMAGR
jgi:hypothetical protein